MSASLQTRAMEGDLSRISAIVKMGKDEHRKDALQTYTEYDSLFQGKDSENKRKGNYTTMVNHFYDLATDFYEYGWGHSFHFATRHKWESFESSIARHEMWIAHKLDLQPGQRVLDVGCGIGGPLRTIARFSGAHVVGLNNNDYQINRAKQLNQIAGITNVSFLKSDFMKISQDENSYDGVYQIEATCHAPDKVGVYKEILRVLKPGQLFAGYEWIMTPKYDPNNPEHVSIKKGIEIGNGLPDIELGEDIVKHLKKAGFEVLEAHDLAPTSDITWFQSLSPSISLSGFMHTGLGRWITGWMVYALEKVHIAPQGTNSAHDMLQAAATNLVLGGQKEIFSPMFFTLCRKPLNK